MNNSNLIPAQPGDVRNPHGRPKGSKNRSTIARMILNLECRIPEEIRADLINLFPDLPATLDAEHLATLVQAYKMILKGDSRAYERLLDSAYGRSIQPVDLTIDDIEFKEMTPEQEVALEQLNELFAPHN